MIDRAGLADFLRRRREALQPEDVGLPRGSVDGVRPASVGRRSRSSATCPPTSTPGWSASAAHSPRSRWSPRSRRACTCPSTSATTSSVWPATTHRSARLRATTSGPGCCASSTGWPTPPPRSSRSSARRCGRPRWATALVGDNEPAAPARPAASATAGSPIRPPGASPTGGPRALLPDVRRRAARCARRPGSRFPRGAPGRPAVEPRARSSGHWWAAHEVGIRPAEVKRYVHPAAGTLELSCQVLHDPFQSHALLVHTATPGSPSHERLQLLTAVGTTAGW